MLLVCVLIQQGYDTIDTWRVQEGLAAKKKRNIVSGAYAAANPHMHQEGLFAALLPASPLVLRETNI